MIPPPKYINFTKIDQLKIFNEVLKNLKAKQGDKLYTNLITDSQCYITGKVFSLDFYLEVLKACYTQKEVKTLLMMFKLARVKLPKKMEVKEYSSILKIIEKKPEKIIIHCSGKDNPEKYLKSFYTILLYFRMNYEKEKVPDLLNNKNLSKYFVEILSSNYDFFSNLNVPDELIFEMMKQKNLSYKIIINSLSYIISIEKVLSVINNNCEIIANCCMKEEKIIYMSELANPKQTDDLNIIITKIKKILDYESKNKKEFISFDQQFWNFYIQFNDNNLKNLLSINKALLLCQKVDKSINPDRLDIKMKIHKNGLSLIKKGELKNEDLIEFIENEDIYFKDKKYETRGFRPLSVLKGIDLEKADDEFFKKWNKSNIFKFFSIYGDEFKKELINLVDDMKDFGKLYKLLNIYEYIGKKNMNNIIILLCEKFKELIKTYRIETCPNFIKDVSFFIYINDKQQCIEKNFYEKNN